MAGSQLTLLILPHEILWQILEIHFSEAVIAIWVQKFIPGSRTNSGGRRLAQLGGHRSPFCFDILLSCKALHRIGTRAMFEFVEIELGEDAEQLITELPPAIPFREFRCITSPLLETKPLEKWPWGNLKEMEVVDIISVDYEDQEEGLHRLV